MGRFSETLMEHFSYPRNSGKLDAPDRVGQAGVPGQGPFMILQLRINGEIISDAKFQTYGCGPSIAAGSMLTEMIIGKTLTHCLDLTSEDLADALEGFPPDKQHCPILAVAALRNALIPVVLLPE